MWSAQQQSMLNAMGYTLYVRPGRSSATEMPAVTSAPQTTALGLPDSSLFKAILKAAQGKDISQLGIDVDALRHNPQAKRALWGQLRKVIKH